MIRFFLLLLPILPPALTASDPSFTDQIHVRPMVPAEAVIYRPVNPGARYNNAQMQREEQFLTREERRSLRFHERNAQLKRAHDTRHRSLIRESRKREGAIRSWFDKRRTVRTLQTFQSQRQIRLQQSQKSRMLETSRRSAATERDLRYSSESRQHAREYLDRQEARRRMWLQR